MHSMRFTREGVRSTTHGSKVSKNTFNLCPLDCLKGDKNTFNLCPLDCLKGDKLHAIRWGFIPVREYVVPPTVPKVCKIGPATERTFSVHQKQL